MTPPAKLPAPLRALSLLLAALCSLSAAGALIERDWLGFPDGHLTPYDEVRGPVLLAGAALGLVAAAALGWLGVSGRRPSSRWVGVGVAVFVALALGLGLYAGFGLEGLDRGQGG